MAQSEVTLLVGMISSGKSTLASRLARAGCVIINDDAIVSALHGGDYTLYSKSLKSLYKTTEQHILTHSIALQQNVVVDRGLNVSVAARRRWIGISNSLDCRVIAIVFKNEGPQIHAKRRADSDCRGHDYDHWLAAAERHHKLWEYPTVAEGFSRVIDSSKL